MEQLRDYQELDVSRILKQKHIGIFSEQRTGKTPVACSVISRATCNMTIVICPNSLVYMWQAALLTWAGVEAEILATSEFKAKGWAGKALIINYEKIRMDSKEIHIVRELCKLHPDCVIVDEAHRIKNRDSLTRKAVSALVRTAKPEYLMALTGTPSPNKLWDVWPILNLISTSAFSSYWNWVDKYFYTMQSFAGAKQPAALRIDVTEQFAAELNNYAIQHTRAEVLEWEVDIPITTVRIPPTADQLKIIEDLTTVFEHKHIFTKNILHAMTVVRQVLSDPKIVGINKSSPKTIWLLNYLKDFKDNSIVVFTLSKKYLELIQKNLVHNKIKHGIITGTTPLKTRQDLIQQFQDGSLKVLLCQTQTVKEGLTLDAADTAIFLDMYPPLADFLQAKDRIVATSKEKVKPKSILCAVMAGTYDEHLQMVTRAGIMMNNIMADFNKYHKINKYPEEVIEDASI